MLYSDHCNNAIARPEQIYTMSLSEVDTLYRQGEMQMVLGEYATALIYFDRVLEINPTYQKAWALRGSVLLGLERYSEALKSCNHALHLCPQDSETWIMHGAILQRMGHYRQAYGSYDRALGTERLSLIEMIRVGVRSLFKTKEFMVKMLAVNAKC